MPDYTVRGWFYYGLLSGLITVALSYVLRVVAGALFLPEIAMSAIISITPAFIESQLVSLLRELAKYIIITVASLTNAFLYGLLAVAVVNLSGSKATRATVAFGLSTLMNISLVVLFSIFSEVSPVRTTSYSLLLGMLPPSILYGLLLTLPTTQIGSRKKIETNKICTTLTPSEAVKSRRRRLFIYTLTSSALASVILVYGLEKILNNNRSKIGEYTTVTSYKDIGNVLEYPSVRSIAEYEITPNDLFYRVDINIIPPSVDLKKWQLKISGLVEREVYLSYGDIVSMPYVEMYSTLECVSNKIGGDLISTAKWRGVRLRDVLAYAGIKDGARYVVFRCYDGYDVGMPIEKALEDNVILAYSMNDAQLPKEHGFPLRVIVPSYYGMMNAKWITEIEVIDETYNGFWQRRGWVNEAEYKIHSTILTPGNAELRKRFPSLARYVEKVILNRRTVIAGVAFAGDRGIEKVEVSVDGGRTWENAVLKDSLSNSTWVIWALEWLPTKSGRTKIMVRSVDKTGRKQTAEVKTPFPDGASGYHVVDVEIKEAE